MNSRKEKVGSVSHHALDAFSYELHASSFFWKKQG